MAREKRDEGAGKLLRRLGEFEDRYFDLVWYARQDKADPNHPGRQEITRIRRENPDQVAALCGESLDWHHGFNSGCLAAVRFIMGLMGTAEEAERAAADFPVLDC